MKTSCDLSFPVILAGRRPALARLSRHKRGLIVALMVLVTMVATKQGYGFELPDVAVLPFIEPQMGGKLKERIKEPLIAARKKLISEQLQSPLSLADYAVAQGAKLTLNSKRLADTIVVGQSQDLPKSLPVSIQPIFCSLADQLIIGSTIAGIRDELILATSYKSIAKSELLAKSEQINEVIADLFRASWREAVAQVGQSPILDPRQNNLKIGLGLAKNSVNQSEGSHLCRILFLQQALAAKYRVQRLMGRFGSAHIQNILGLAMVSQKATRQIIVTWLPEIQRTWPLPLRFNARLSEAVFAAPIPDLNDLEMTVSTDKISQLPAKLSQFLEGEQQKLDLAGSPRVVYINGAWAYLDKGRAYGLNMADRLLHMEGDLRIKGHIVGYYGPGMRLKNATGQALYEGAIMYVRQGRDRLILGQAFNFDPTSYPTSWPPQKTPEIIPGGP